MPFGFGFLFLFGDYFVEAVRFPFPNWDSIRVGFVQSDSGNPNTVEAIFFDSFPCNLFGFSESFQMVNEKFLFISPFAHVVFHDICFCFHKSFLSWTTHLHLSKSKSRYFFISQYVHFIRTRFLRIYFFFNFCITESKWTKMFWLLLKNATKTFFNFFKRVIFADFYWGFAQFLCVGLL